MIRAILFDFNGVVVDDEPLHFELFQRVLKENGWQLNKEDYYQKYLGMDDYDCFTHALQDQGEPPSLELIEKLTSKKNDYYFKAIDEKPPFVPGVLEWVEQVGQTHFLGIVSGALREEIEYLLKVGNIAQYFSVIVAAGEIEHGKPAPEGYVKAMELLNRDFVAANVRLLPEECLVIEDSSWGLQAGQGAGMPTVGVTTSYSAESLPEALFCIQDFTQLSPPELILQVENKIAKVSS